MVHNSSEARSLIQLLSISRICRYSQQRKLLYCQLPATWSQCKGLTSCSTTGRGGGGCSWCHLSDPECTKQAPCGCLGSPPWDFTLTAPAPSLSAHQVPKNCRVPLYNVDGCMSVLSTAAVVQTRSQTTCSSHHVSVSCSCSSRRNTARTTVHGGDRRHRPPPRPPPLRWPFSWAEPAVGACSSCATTEPAGAARKRLHSPQGEQ